MGSWASTQLASTPLFVTYTLAVSVCAFEVRDEAMMNSAGRAFDEVAHLAGRMDSTQWIGVMVAAVFVGYFVLRGYGSQL